MAKNITVTTIFVSDDIRISAAEVNNIKKTYTKYSRSFPEKLPTFVCNSTA